MTAMGQANALAVLAVGDQGTFLHALICIWKNWWLARQPRGYRPESAVGTEPVQYRHRTQ